MKNIILICFITLFLSSCNLFSDKFEGEWKCVDSNFTGSSKTIVIRKLENNGFELKWGNTTGTTDPQTNPDVINYYNYEFRINDSGQLVISNRFSGCSAYEK